MLKGATLFRLWCGDSPRATWDLDLLGRGANSVGDVTTVVRELCEAPGEDGIVFAIDSIKGEVITAHEKYPGVRVRFEARLAEARIPMQVDVGFGDAVSPDPVRESYPVHLDHEPPRILAYPREAVVAEKLEAMISLGVTNSRMKDFHDVFVLASSFPFEGITLVGAIRATFNRRETPPPLAEPLVLRREFLAAPERQAQWRAFLRRSGLKGPADAGELSDQLRRFIGPVLGAVATSGGFAASWPAGGPWLEQ